MIELFVVQQHFPTLHWRVVPVPYDIGTRKQEAK